MSKLIPYAGFDPDENNLDDIELAPLHPQDLVKRSRPGPASIDTNRAWRLKHLGKSWKEVGEILAREEGRKIPFLGPSVYSAANYARAAE